LVYASEDRPGGKLWQISTAGELFWAAVERDVQGILNNGIRFKPGSTLNLVEIVRSYQAVYMAGEEGASFDDVSCRPGAFRGKEFLMNGVTVVEAVASGRQSAMAIQRYLTSLL